LTRFLEEVNEQPQALFNLVSFYRNEGARLLEEWKKLLNDHKDLVFCGMGTSEFAPLLIQDKLLSLEKSVSIYDAGEYLHYLLGGIASGRLHVLISQSGESAETKKVAQALGGKEPLVVLANSEESTMACLADLFLPMKAGAESSVTNKTYLNTLALVYLMAGGSLGKLEEVAGYLGTSCNEAEVVEAAEFLQPADSLHFIARGPAMAAARQLALTFMEGARSHAAAFSGGAFRHGPFEVVGEGHRAVYLAPEGKTSSLCLAMAAEMARRGSRILLITDSTDVPAQDRLRVIGLKSFGDERLFPLALVVVQGYLLHHVARLRGFEAGVFTQISKVTTIE